MISKEKLRLNVVSFKIKTKAALQTVFDSLNKGQQKKLLNVPEVKALFDRYGVDTDL